MSPVPGQKAEGRKQKAVSRRQKAEVPRRRTKDEGRKSDAPSSRAKVVRSKPATPGSRVGVAGRRSRVGSSRPNIPSQTPKTQNSKLKTQNSEDTPQSGERLQKVLAHAGVASRRAAEELIAAGRVMVNGAVVREMGVRVQPSDVIQVDSKRLDVPAPAQAAQALVYIAINKPLGVVSTSKDPQGRATVLDLLKRPLANDDGRRTTDDGAEGRRQRAEGSDSLKSKVQSLRSDKSAIREGRRTEPQSAIGRVYPIGRLDVDSTGLLLLTNDGDLTFRVTHPKYGLEKEYHTLVRGRPVAEAIQKLREGVDIEGGLTAPAKVAHLSTVGGNTWLRITIKEGRKRQVRLMVAAVGHPVIELQRTRVGPIMLGELEPGRWRYLALHEVHALRKAVGLHATTRKDKG